MRGVVAEWGRRLRPHQCLHGRAGASSRSRRGSCPLGVTPCPTARQTPRPRSGTATSRQSPRPGGWPGSETTATINGRRSRGRSGAGSRSSDRRCASTATKRKRRRSPSAPQRSTDRSERHRCGRVRARWHRRRHGQVPDRGATRAHHGRILGGRRPVEPAGLRRRAHGGAPAAGDGCRRRVSAHRQFSRRRSVRQRRALAGQVSGQPGRYPSPFRAVPGHSGVLQRGPRRRLPRQPDGDADALGSCATKCAT